MLKYFSSGEFSIMDNVLVWFTIILYFNYLFGFGGTPREGFTERGALNSGAISVHYVEVIPTANSIFKSNGALVEWWSFIAYNLFNTILCCRRANTTQPQEQQRWELQSESFLFNKASTWS